MVSNLVPDKRKKQVRKTIKEGGRVFKVKPPAPIVEEPAKEKPKEEPPEEKKPEPKKVVPKPKEPEEERRTPEEQAELDGKLHGAIVYWPAMNRIGQCNEEKVLEEARKAIEAGANINCQDVLGRTALMLAIKSGEIELIKLILRKGANVNLKDNQGRSALTYAKSTGSTRIINIIKDAGVKE